jgi:hypothetical protein
MNSRNNNKNHRQPNKISKEIIAQSLSVGLISLFSAIHLPRYQIEA